MRAFSGRDTSRGQSLTEFALLLPVLLLIVMALFDFGRAVFYLNSVSEAARTGSRIAVVNQSSPIICQVVAERAIGLGLPAACVGGSVVPGISHVSDCDDIDCEQIVTVKARFQPIVPVIGTIIGQIDVSSSSTVHVERVCPPTLPGESSCPTP